MSRRRAALRPPASAVSDGRLPAHWTALDGVRLHVAEVSINDYISQLSSEWLSLSQAKPEDRPRRAEIRALMRRAHEDHRKLSSFDLALIEKTIRKYTRLRAVQP